MSKFTVYVLVGMVSQTSLKLLYFLPSVDKIRPVRQRIFIVLRQFVD